MDEILKRPTSMSKLDKTSHAEGRQLQPGESVDSHRIGMESSHVADDQDPATVQHPVQPVTQ